MAIELIGSLFVHSALPDNALFSIVGLLIYGLIFAALAAWWFRWEVWGRRFWSWEKRGKIGARWMSLS